MKFFVDMDSLRAFFPRIADYVGSSSADFSFQIGEGRRQALDALRARGLKVRQIGKPLDLLRPYGSTETADGLTELEQTPPAAKECTFIEGLDGFNRLALLVTFTTLASGKQLKAILQGANDVEASLEDPPASWETIATLAISGSGDASILFEEEFRWYRLILSPDADLAASVKISAWLQETAIERLCIYKTLAIIMRGISKDPQDIFSARATEMEQAFETALSAITVSVDSDNDNVPTEGEQTSGGGVAFSR